MKNYTSYSSHDIHNQAGGTFGAFGSGKTGGVVLDLDIFTSLIMYSHTGRFLLNGKYR